MTFTDCQRAKCGAKNIFMTHICLKRLNYFSAAVEDESKDVSDQMSPHKPVHVA